MSTHLVLGAGGIGRSIAASLSQAGEQVVLASRSGRDPRLPGVTAMPLDATDHDAVAGAAGSAVTIVNALNPASYTHWQRDWPPMATAALAAAERSGARLITIGNLYGYGRVDGPMTEATPRLPNGTKGQVRVEMWHAALTAHQAGRVPATEVRASDYVGAATLTSSLLDGYVVKALVAGKTPMLPMGRRDVPHSWTVDADVAALVRELALAADDSAYGQAWHVPTDRAVSSQRVADLTSDLLGRPPVRVRVLPRSVVSAGGAVVPLLRELRETRHQFERPFVLDSTVAQQRFDLRPTPLVDALAATIAALRTPSTH